MKIDILINPYFKLKFYFDLYSQSKTTSIRINHPNVKEIRNDLSILFGIRFGSDIEIATQDIPRCLDFLCNRWITVNDFERIRDDIKHINELAQLKLKVSETTITTSQKDIIISVIEYFAADIATFSPKITDFIPIVALFLNTIGANTDKVRKEIYSKTFNSMYPQEDFEDSNFESILSLYKVFNGSMELVTTFARTGNFIPGLNLQRKVILDYLLEAFKKRHPLPLSEFEQLYFDLAIDRFFNHLNKPDIDLTFNINPSIYLSYEYVISGWTGLPCYRPIKANILSEFQRRLPRILADQSVNTILQKYKLKRLPTSANEIISLRIDNNEEIITDPSEYLKSFHVDGVYHGLNPLEILDVAIRTADTSMIRYIVKTHALDVDQLSLNLIKEAHEMEKQFTKDYPKEYYGLGEFSYASEIVQARDTIEMRTKIQTDYNILKYTVSYQFFKSAWVLIDLGASVQKAFGSVRYQLHDLMYIGILDDESELIANKIVKALLAKDPSALNRQNKYGRTPLHWANKSLGARNVDLLLELGADKTILDNDGFLAYDRTLRYQERGLDYPQLQINGILLKSSSTYSDALLYSICHLRKLNKLIPQTSDISNWYKENLTTEHKLFISQKMSAYLNANPELYDYLQTIEITDTLKAKLQQLKSSETDFQPESPEDFQFYYLLMHANIECLSIQKDLRLYCDDMYRAGNLQRYGEEKIYPSFTPKLLEKFYIKQTFKILFAVLTAPYSGLAYALPFLQQAYDNIVHHRKVFKSITRIVSSLVTAIIATAMGIAVGMSLGSFVPVVGNIIGGIIGGIYGLGLGLSTGFQLGKQLARVLAFLHSKFIRTEYTANPTYPEKYSLPTDENHAQPISVDATNQIQKMLEKAYKNKQNISALPISTTDKAVLSQNYNSLITAIKSQPSVHRNSFYSTSKLHFKWKNSEWTEIETTNLINFPVHR